MSENKTWLTHPNKKQIIIYLIIWFIGTSLLVIATTDLFTKTIFTMSPLMLMMIIGATFPIPIFLTNYRKNKSNAEGAEIHVEE